MELAPGGTVRGKGVGRCATAGRGQTAQIKRSEAGRG
jgi:hypothetical protein